MSDPAAGLDMYEEAASPSIEPWQHGPALVKCSTSWCGPCKTIAHIVDAFFVSSPPNIICADIDVDKIYTVEKRKGFSEIYEN